MDELAQLHCSPITANTPRLNKHDVSQLKVKLPGWRTYEKGAELRLEKVFDFIMAAKTEQLYGDRHGNQK